MKYKSKLSKLAWAFVFAYVSFACAKEKDFANPSGTEIAVGQESSQAQDGVVAPLNIEFSLDNDGVRAVQYIIGDRGNGYTNEFTPLLRPSSGATSALLTLVKKGDPKSLRTQSVYVRALEDKPSRYFFRGEVLLNQGYSFGDGEWYAMLSTGHDHNDGISAYYGTSSSDAHNADTDNRLNLSGGIGVVGAELGSSFQINSIPYFSQWVKVKVERIGIGTAAFYTGSFNDAVLKPQGVVLQYDVVDDVYGMKDTRRNAIISNTLDFSGRYDFSTEKLYQSFATRDALSGIGLPEWVSDQPKLSEYKLYKVKNNPLTIGEAVFPWDVPAASDSWTPTQREDLITKDFLEEIALDGDAHGFIPIPEYYESPHSGMTTQWNFAYQTGQRRLWYIWGMPRAVAPNKPYTYFVSSIYGREVESDRYTHPTIDPKILSNRNTKLSNYLVDKNRVAVAAARIEQLVKDSISYTVEPAGETADVKAKRLARLAETSLLLSNGRINLNRLEADEKVSFQNIGANYDATEHTKIREDLKQYYRSLRKDAIQQQTARTQPLMVIHQTNAIFSRTADRGKVKHIQTALTNDLLITEQAYKRADNGKVYTFLEITNTTNQYVDLRRYAVARLIPHNGYLAYRRADGTATDNLSEALILPLTAVDPEVTDPFAAGSYMSSWSPQARGSYDRLNKNIPGAYNVPSMYPNYDRWNMIQLPNKGSLVDMKRAMYPGKTDFYIYGLKDGDIMPLLSKQTVVLGGANFLDRVRLQKYTNGIDRDLVGSELGTSISTSVAWRWAMAYNDGPRLPDGSLGEGTLDFKPGDAFVLLKKQPSHGGWQIVDATGPIGPHHLGYRGTYEQFASKVAGRTEFSLRRAPYVVFSSIFPFRSKSTVADRADDWEQDVTFAQHSIGHGNPDLASGANNWGFARTPLDFSGASKYYTTKPIQ